MNYNKLSLMPKWLEIWKIKRSKENNNNNNLYIYIRGTMIKKKKKN